jgi:hypothetical protein
MVGGGGGDGDDEKRRAAADDDVMTCVRSECDTKTLRRMPSSRCRTGEAGTRTATSVVVIPTSDDVLAANRRASCDVDDERANDVTHRLAMREAMDAAAAGAGNNKGVMVSFENSLVMSKV